MGLKCSIIDGNFREPGILSTPALWLEWECINNGIDVCPPGDADYLLCTLSAPREVAIIKSKLSKIKDVDKKKIIIGGACTSSPAFLDELVDTVCVGEGRNFIRTLGRNGYDAARKLQESWNKGETREVIPSQEFPWDVPPIKGMGEDPRLMISRGCRKKCLFCQEGWWFDYRINPLMERTERISKNLKRRKIKHLLVSNDASFDAKRMLKEETSASVTLSALKVIIKDGIPKKKKLKCVRIGVEGISERIRYAVGKPVRNDELLQITDIMLTNNIQVNWNYMIGLPCESERDWKELYDLTFDMKGLHKYQVICIFHSFIPQPATPLAMFPLDDQYWEHWLKYRFWRLKGPGLHKRMREVGPAKPESRMKRAMLSMDATEQELREGWFERDNSNWRVKYKYPPEKLREIARIYERKISN